MRRSGTPSSPSLSDSNLSEQILQLMKTSGMQRFVKLNKTIRSSIFNLERLINVVEANTRAAKTSETNVRAVLGYMGRMEERLNDLHEGFGRVASSFLVAQDNIAIAFPLTTLEDVLSYPETDPDLIKFRAR